MSIKSVLKSIIRNSFAPAFNFTPLGGITPLATLGPGVVLIDQTGSYITDEVGNYILD